ncbi:MAG: Terminase [Bacteriophage sp.]|nr:MAG: terminase [Bacteriophage sp.]UVM91549.1 MAG: terminase [Bacteriophage sp.]UVN01811.1 MAG: terminase [Bacteriophage sp.]UVX34523.1 MAG: Terminase [Bacteriophage sp.]UVX36036.1 MAG: Terminase [Bacteriophage sp.]
MFDPVQDYIDLVERGYIEGRKYIVEDGQYKEIHVDIKVGKKIQKAIERHQREVELSKEPNYPYYYDPTKAIPVIRFMEMLPDPKSRKPMKLATFQKFIIGLLYGWRKKKDDTRRFRKAYISLARKNGKSLIVAGIALYEFLFGKNPVASRQVVAAANTKDQAGIVFRMLKSQLLALRSVSKEVKKRTTVRRYDIEASDESTVKPLSSDADTLDGLDVLCGILDEYGEAKTTDIIEVLESSQSQQLEGLILLISTTTKNLNGPMHSVEYPFIEKLLNEEVKGDAYLALCWEMDSLSEVEDESNWIKSNPLFEIPEAYDSMLDHKRNSLDEYKGKLDLSGWLTKEMNFWVQSSKDSFVSKEEWDAIKAPQQYDIKGRKAYIGLDIARTSDMTAVSWVIPIEEEKKLLMDSHGFVSTVGGIDYKTGIDKIPYRQYEQMGLIHLSEHPEGIIEVEQMTQWVQDFINANELQLIGIYYDPALANRAVADLSKVYPNKLIEVPQRINYLSAPTKNLRDLILRKEIMHANNPLLTRAAYNAQLREYNDAYAIDKAINRNKIDALDAIINCMVDAQYHDFDAPTLQDLIDEGKFGFGF